MVCLGRHVCKAQRPWRSCEGLHKLTRSRRRSTPLDPPALVGTLGGGGPFHRPVPDTLQRVSLELPELRTIDVDGPVAFRTWDGPSDTTFVCVHGLGASHLSWVQVAPEL